MPESKICMLVTKPDWQLQYIYVLYYTRERNKLSKCCNFSSSKVRHKILSAKFLETPPLTTLHNLIIFLTI